MKKIGFFTIAFFCLLTVSNYGQTNCFLTDDPLERQRCDELEKRNTEAVYKTRFTKPDKDLVAENPGSWVLHIVTQGGLSGKGLPTVTMTSEGTFACGENDLLQFQPLISNLQFKPLASKTFVELSNEIANTDFKIDKSSDTAIDSLPYFCKDCYQTSILIARRDLKNKIKTFENDEDLTKYPKIANVFKNIRNQAFELTNCQ